MRLRISEIYAAGRMAQSVASLYQFNNRYWKFVLDNVSAIGYSFYAGGRFLIKWVCPQSERKEIGVIIFQILHIVQPLVN